MIGLNASKHQAETKECLVISAHEKYFQTSISKVVSIRLKLNSFFTRYNERKLFAHTLNPRELTMENEHLSDIEAKTLALQKYQILNT